MVNNGGGEEDYVWNLLVYVCGASFSVWGLKYLFVV